MSLNEGMFTGGEDEGLFWRKDDILDRAFVIMVLLGSAPLCVILVIGEGTHHAPVVSSKQLPHFMRIPGKCEPCAFTGNHNLSARLSFLARKIAL